MHSEVRNNPHSVVQNKLNRFRKQALARDIPSGDVERWLATARPCATLAPLGDGPVVGRLAGPRMLPVGVSVEELLIASLDLAALPEHATDLPLPRDGRLLLFADPEGGDPEVNCGTAMYIPVGTDVEESQWEPVEDQWVEKSDIQGELRLTYNVSLPDHNSIIDTAEHPYADELRQIDPGGEEGEPTDWAHQLHIGGYANDAYREQDPVTSSARKAAAAERAGYRPGSGEPTSPEDWVLLAQFLPDIGGLENLWVHWTIRRQDLVARRLDRVYVTTTWRA